MNRRQFVLEAGMAPLAGAALFRSQGVPSRSAIDAAHAAGSYEQTMPDMLVTFMTSKINAWAAQWDRKRAGIKTAQQVLARNRFVREKAVEMIHGFPAKNPLNAQIVRVLERKGYRIECLMYESQPDFWVTSSLYVPTTGEGPFPGIISPCGHYALARANPSYQSAYLNLVTSGFVVLAPDPIGEGERREFWNPRTRRNETGGPVTWEHSLPGQQLLLLGEDLTHYRIWDCMRAIDYLLTRPEVDPKRIGCAGHSGGGTLTMFVSALDERIQCAVINEGGTANRWPKHIQPHAPLGTGDTEQHFFPGAIYGIDDVDLHVAIAPRPLLATIEHYAPPFDRAAQAIEERYRQLGVPEHFSTVPAEDPHAWTVKLRLATTDWFCRWFYHRRGPVTEPEFVIEPDENLHCTIDGSVRYSHQGQTIFSLILKKQAQLPPARILPPSSASFENEMRANIHDVLRLKRINQPLVVQHYVTTPRKGYKIEKLAFLSEPGIYIPVWVFIPENYDGQGEALIYVDERGAAVDGLEFGVLDGLATKGRLVIAADVRGIGATRPPHLAEESRAEFWQLDDVETVLTYWAWVVNEDLFGMRVQDVLRTVDYALSRSDVNQSGVQLIGNGMGALWALYAAALDARIRSVVCSEGLLSYHNLADVDRYLQEASIFVRNVMTQFDLPQVAAAVAERNVALLAPVDGMKEPVDSFHAHRAYQTTEAMYESLGVPNRFRISMRDPEISLSSQYLALLNGT
ncbi:MAG: alpha/beta hydrolase family protein [Terriglobia bacterium]